MNQVKPMKLLHSPVLQVRRQQNAIWLYLINCLRSQIVFVSLATQNKCIFCSSFLDPPFASRDNHFSPDQQFLLILTKYNCIIVVFLDFFLIFIECPLCSRLFQTLGFQQRSKPIPFPRAFIFGVGWGLTTKPII